mmetsp:Transcript_128312/g.363106  ORF Transcript_128312/g.363106 Transcript_128312/m.363106 type:complete len:205 (+) Transcript_128312:901-1515(+)
MATRWRRSAATSLWQTSIGATSGERLIWAWPCPFGCILEMSRGAGMARETGVRTSPQATAPGCWKQGAQYEASAKACRVPTAMAAMRPSKCWVSCGSRLRFLGYTRLMGGRMLVSSLAKASVTSSGESLRQSRESSLCFDTDTMPPVGAGPTQTGSSGPRNKRPRRCCCCGCCCPTARERPDDGGSLGALDGASLPPSMDPGGL